MTDWQPHGLTDGQAARLRSWLLDQAAAAEHAAETLPPDSKWHGFHRGHADAYRAAEGALRVASVGAL